MHIYTTLKFHLTCARMAKINKQMTAYAIDDVRKITQAGGSAATMNINMWFLRTLGINVPQDPARPLSSIHP